MGDTPDPGMCVVNGKVARFCLLGVGWVYGWEDRALQECNLSAQPSVDSGCIRSRRCLAVAPGDWFGRRPQPATVPSAKLIVAHTFKPD
jgi:hypothetical protein